MSKAVNFYVVGLSLVVMVLGASASASETLALSTEFTHIYSDSGSASISKAIQTIVKSVSASQGIVDARIWAKRPWADMATSWNPVKFNVSADLGKCEFDRRGINLLSGLTEEIGDSKVKELTGKVAQKVADNQKAIDAQIKHNQDCTAGSFSSDCDAIVRDFADTKETTYRVTMSAATCPMLSTGFGRQVMTVTIQRVDQTHVTISDIEITGTGKTY